jgi:hypothetical protein
MYPSSPLNPRQGFEALSQLSVAWAEMGKRKAETKVKLRAELAKDLIFKFPPDVTNGSQCTPVL